MNFKDKNAVVKRLAPSLKRLLQINYEDEVGCVKHTPRTVYLVLKRVLKDRGGKCRRAEMRRFAKIAFFLRSCPELDRRQVELVYRQVCIYSHILDLMGQGFDVSVGEVFAKIESLRFLVQAPIARFFSYLRILFAFNRDMNVFYHTLAL